MHLKLTAAAVHGPGLATPWGTRERRGLECDRHCHPAYDRVMNTGVAERSRSLAERVGPWYHFRGEPNDRRAAAARQGPSRGAAAAGIRASCAPRISGASRDAVATNCAEDPDRSCLVGAWVQHAAAHSGTDIRSAEPVTCKHDLLQRQVDDPTRPGPAPGSSARRGNRFPAGCGSHAAATSCGTTLCAVATARLILRTGVGQEKGSSDALAYNLQTTA
jgi:hypothetical protein